ncbi:MAG: cell division protein FtsW [Candidatus Niyogibacteria bacterium]|nr:cell division protein FtsW [Candidatus Niyogibacteria bacterium]
MNVDRNSPSGGSRDWVLAGLSVVLIAMGFFALVSASLGLLDDARSPIGVLTRQFLFALGVGIAGLVVADRIPMAWLRRAASGIFIIAFVISLAVFVPGIGFQSGGAYRWIAAGPLFFQPAELLKIGFIIYLAAWLASRNGGYRSAEFGVLSLLGMVAALGALFIRQPDIGTLGVILLTGTALFYAGGGQLRHVGLVGLAVAVFLIIGVLLRPYALDRVLVFVDPSFDPQGAGYQVRQAAIAFGSGGSWGRGFGQSTQKFSYLPEPMGDAIFAVIGEEFGFAGAAALVLLFLAFLWRVVLVVFRVRDPFARLLGLGVGILITVQAFINMGALVGIVPLTGITLPFISHGGSSLAITLVGVGILLNVSRHRTTI